ncbi:carbohydrate ABC transporter permease [Alicyclobacillus fodiniaquatilis]|uniref:Carbohydrate ABC transporter permease n=1 Tax=Alicyclobacillus fodiniaquatilis TaxID=1661150 RepID=A0ABW4JML1_9BACL
MTTRPMILHELQRGKKRTMRNGKTMQKTIVYVLLILLALVFLFPFFWIISTSLMTTAEQESLPLTWWPKHLQWHNYVVAWTTLPFGQYLWHTVIIVVFSTLGTMLSSVFCAYGFARIRFPGRNILFMFVLSTMMLPGVVTMIPIYLIMKDLGWLNTYYPMIVPAFFGGGAANIFLLRQFMMGLPVELEEAARIDGASRFTTFTRIFLPLMKPALAVVGWGAALAAWGDIMGPLIYLTDQSKSTFALGMDIFSTAMPTGWGSQLEMAIAAVAILPVLVGFFFIQRWLIEGINLTGVAR